MERINGKKWVSIEKSESVEILNKRIGRERERKKKKNQRWSRKYIHKMIEANNVN